VIRHQKGFARRLAVGKVGFRFSVLFGSLRLCDENSPRKDHQRTAKGKPTFLICEPATVSGAACVILVHLKLKRGLSVDSRCRSHELRGKPPLDVRT